MTLRAVDPELTRELWDALVAAHRAARGYRDGLMVAFALVTGKTAREIFTDLSKIDEDDRRNSGSSTLGGHRRIPR